MLTRNPQRQCRDFFALAAPRLDAMPNSGQPKSRNCGSLFAPIEPLFHFQPCLEVRGSPFWNRDEHTRLGITASASFTNFHRKRPESAQLDTITARQCSGNFVENSMDDCLDFLTVQVWVLVPNAPNEIGLNHAKFPLGRGLAGIRKCSGPEVLFNGESVARLALILHPFASPVRQINCLGVVSPRRV